MTDLLRIASWFFFAQGAFYFLIGALTPLFLGRVDATLFFTPRSDSGYFGNDTGDLQNEDPNLTKLRNLLLLAVAGLLVALGLAVMAVAWFLVRAGDPRGYWSLVAVGGSALLYWVAIVWKYVAAGAPVGLGDIPPFMWVTTLLWLAGVATGAFGLRTT